MNRVRTTVAAAALTVPLLLATGCGIATTGVIESGSAGTVKLATAPDPGLLYFIAPGGALVPVPVSDRMQRPDIGFTIGMLLEGPNEAAREAGLTTEIPALGTRAGTYPFAKFDGTDGKPVEVRLPIPVGPLSGPARRQLACTAIAAVHTSATPDVLLVGPDGEERRATCQVEPEG
ncbi:hypothetical protein [Streptomyces sp. H34-S4]|uniref:hypothetical protein n=1 Tax=Streptomyces sp. H34-S4 TaxID=2996463 RepID=UPI00226E55D4|nr:hypothetical protein [Streptomyces sp. H34-S4]MCY0937086.1 hypothetical protein [Streptomyces sp. H34-S4]